jgi:hypothetical protein
MKKKILMPITAIAVTMLMVLSCSKSENNTNQNPTTTNTTVKLPVLTTTAIVLGPNSITGGGNVTSDGGGAITARGVCWAKTTNPTIANSKTTEAGTVGAFSSVIPRPAGTGNLYYVRAYATNSAGTAYGNEEGFGL